MNCHNMRIQAWGLRELSTALVAFVRLDTGLRKISNTSSCKTDYVIQLQNLNLHEFAYALLSFSSMTPHVRIGCIGSPADSSAFSCDRSMHRHRQNRDHSNCIRRAVCFQFYAYILDESVMEKPKFTPHPFSTRSSVYIYRQSCPRPKTSSTLIALYFRFIASRWCNGLAWMSIRIIAVGESFATFCALKGWLFVCLKGSEIILKSGILAFWQSFHSVHHLRRHSFDLADRCHDLRRAFVMQRRSKILCHIYRTGSASSVFE